MAIITLKSLLSTLRVTVTGAKWLFVIFALALVLTVWMYWGYVNNGHAFSFPDIVHIVVIFALMLSFAWLGFSVRGQKLLVESGQEQPETTSLARVLKVLFASGAMALGILIVIAVLVLIINGPQLITVRSFSWGFYLLTAICFPFVYKWLK